MTDDIDWSKRIKLPRVEKIPARKRKGRMPDPSLLTVRETARALNLAVADVEAWIELNIPPIECVRFGRMVRYRRTDVARYLRTQKQDETGDL